MRPVVVVIWAAAAAIPTMARLGTPADVNATATTSTTTTTTTFTHTTKTTTTTTEAPAPSKAECKPMMIAALDAADIDYRYGVWQYGGMSGSLSWPSTAVDCAALCDGSDGCLHWVYDCRNLQCSLYKQGGYEEDGDPQFGHDYCFLGDSLRAQTTTTTSTEV